MSARETGMECGRQNVSETNAALQEGPVDGLLEQSVRNKGGRPRRKGVPLKNITVQVLPDTHQCLHVLSRAYGISLGGIVDKMVERAMRKLQRKVETGGK